MTTSAEFLVVEDHPMVMRTLKTYLQRVGTVVEAGTVQEGLKAFEEHPNLAGMLVDVNLPDGLGTDLIREIRRRDPVLPILMLTGSDERGWANEAHALGVEFVFKPIVTESLERFSARAVARASSGDDSLAAVVSELVSSHGLSPREVQVLTLSLGGTPRVALTDEMGVSDNTVKTTVRHLLRKTTADTLDDLVQYVMRAALHRRNVGTSSVGTGSAGTGSTGTGSTGTGSTGTGSAGTGNVGSTSAGTSGAGTSNVGSNQAATGNAGMGTDAARSSRPPARRAR